MLVTLTKKTNFMRYFQFFLVILAAGAIYPIMFLKMNYQETILEIFNISLPQLNTIYLVLGIVWVIGYFPSGLISDKFSSKKLLTVSLLGTALGGFWFAQIPPYSHVAIIYGIWGIFSVFTFWSAHMKLVKMLAKKEEQGRFFGILDGGRGVVEAILSSFALFIFSKVLSGGVSLDNKRTALISIIYMCSIILVVIGILIAIFIQDDTKLEADSLSAEKSKRQEFKLVDLKKVLRNKFVYILGGIVFMSYSVYWTVYYLGGFLQTNIGVDAVRVGTIMLIVQWMRPVGGILGGFFADRFGKGKITGVALMLAAIFLLTLALMPPAAEKVFFYFFIIALGFFLYVIRGTYWSLLDDCKIPTAIIGTAIGTISLFGYLPDMILPTVNSFLFNTFGDNTGYNAYFITSAVLGMIGLILISIFKKLNSRGQ